MVNIINDNEYIIDGSLKNYLIYLDYHHINIKYDISTSCNIIIINNYDGNVCLNDYGVIKNYSEVSLTYVDLNKDEYRQDSKIDVYESSSLKVTSKYLSLSNKDIKLNYINKEAHTDVMIDNSCICMNDSSLILECIGKIEKGAKVSKNLQASRCLTIDNPKKALVKPVLLIDENDVEASHSLSSGTIDQDVLYYLNSRGISYHDAMILFIHSYLMPQDNLLEGFENKEDILKNIENKVVNLYA